VTKTVQTLFFAILIMSPLAWGTVETWSLALMEASAFLALFLCCRAIVKEEGRTLYEVPGLLPLSLLLGFMLMQVLPLPVGLVQVLSPETGEIYKQTLELDGPAGWVSLSLNRKATIMEFFRVSSYSAFYVLTVQLLAGRGMLRRTVSVVAIFASGLAMLAIVQHLLPGHFLFAFREYPGNASPFGPYINRNHYAGLMGMLFPVVYAAFLYSRPTVESESFRDTMTRLLDRLSTSNHLSLGFSAILIIASVAVSLSRGGMLCIAASMIFFGLLLTWRGVGRGKGLAALLVVSLVVIYVGWYGWAPVFERFGNILGPEGEITLLRPRIWDDVSHIAQDFPSAGTGFGTLVDIYPKYRSIPGTDILAHAHNDYLQLFSDGGLPAAVFVAWFLAAVGIASFRTAVRRKDIQSIFLFAGAATGVFSMLLHSFADFNLQIGANGLVFFFLLGLSVSASHTRFHSRRGSTYLREAGSGRLKRLLPAGAFVLLLVSLLFNGGILLGEIFAHGAEPRVMQRADSQDEVEEVQRCAARATRFDPLDGEHWYARAVVERTYREADSSLAHLKKALRAVPVRAEYLQRLGQAWSDRGEFEKADSFFRAGITFDPRNASRYRVYGSWLLSRGEIGEGVRHARKAVSLDPAETEQFITLMVLYGMTDEEILSALPERTDPFFRFAAYLLGVGREDLAEEAYREGLRHADREERIQPRFYFTVSGFYRQRGRYDEALMVMREAIGAVPDSASVREGAAALYEKVGNTYRAAEEYQAALLINPGSERARRGLQRVKSP
jgi:tetratricopeptide (TPR) repeat protein